MRAVVQRVREAVVQVDGTPVGAIGRGLLVLLGVGTDDTPRDAETGTFQAHMQVALVNDGPVTLWLDTEGG